MRWPRHIPLVAFFLAGLTAAARGEGMPQQLTVSGGQGSLPPGYVPPLVSNGSLSMLIDYQGGQSQRAYAGMTPGIWWAGRRYGPPADQLVPFGHFEQELTCGGRSCQGPSRWTQSLDTRNAATTCRCDYGDSLAVETTVFVPLEHDVIVIRKRLFARTAAARSARIGLKYLFAPPGDTNRPPRRTLSTGAWNATTSSIDVAYQVDGYRTYAGAISMFCDQAATAQIDRQSCTLSASLVITADHPAEITFYLLFADSFDGKDYRQRAERLKSHVKTEGFAGLLAEHRRQWAGYWDDSEVRVPDERLQRAYCTAQYHLRANATRWSFPAGILDTHWAGRYFGWDEMFCYLGLASSNHLAVAARVPEFRLACLPKALYRTSHYFTNTISYGARYPWETLEDGSEASPPGFWHDHVFHMSNIALCSWFQYLYTDDRRYLRSTGYPVIKECATFFLKQMVYEDSNGSMFLGKCTDLERLGPTRQNPFMTSCGAIFAMEAAAGAAGLLQVDDELRAQWVPAAAKLRQSLPHNAEQYVPYAGCPDRSIAVLGGVFPYPVLDPHSTLQKNAVYDFVKNCGQFGNCYPVGKSVSGWYCGWMAAALAALGDRSEAVNRLSQAAQGAGCFAEMFEINEEKVVMRPWFSDAAGSFVYALNQVLLQSRDARILIAPAVPEDWRQFSFKLACHGNLVAEVAVQNGRVAELTLVPGNLGETLTRTLIIPDRLLDPRALNKDAVTSISQHQGDRWLDVRFKGRLRLIGASR